MHAQARKTKNKKKSGTIAVRNFQTSWPCFGFRSSKLFAEMSTAEVQNKTLYKAIYSTYKHEKKLTSKFGLQIDVVMYMTQFSPIRRKRRKGTYEYK
jgi:hypothetical protein